MHIKLVVVYFLQQSRPIRVSTEFSSFLKDNNITNNNCIRGSGGGLAIHFLAVPSIISCNFYNNSAVSGGGISITDGSSPILSHCIIENNFASSSGGGVVIQGFAEPIFHTCTFSYNNANSSGGALVIKDISKPIIQNSIIENNTSPNEGGAAVFTDKSSSTFNNCSIQNNKSGGSGGAFVFAITATGNFSNCSIVNNEALSSGGGISFQNECSPIFIDIFLTNNTASEGGGLSIEDTANPMFVSSELKLNIARSHGGCILASDFGIGNFINCTIAENNAPSGRGGGIKMDDYSYVYLYGCSLLNNTADTGGGIYTSSKYGPLIYSSIFTSNYARFHGGAIVYASLSGGEMLNCLIDNNKADESGGGIHFQDESKPTIKDTIFSNNKVILGAEGLGQGGGISLWDSCTPTLSNCSFLNNVGILGGGCYIHILGAGSFENLLFDSNIGEDGGGIHARGFESSMVNITIQNNNAISGGGIYLDSSFSLPKDTICDNCTFKNNIANNTGGGLYIKTIFDITASLSIHSNIQYYSDEDESCELLPAEYYYENKNKKDKSLPSSLLYDNDKKYQDFLGSNSELDILKDIFIFINSTREFNFKNPIFYNNTALRGGAIYHYGGLPLLNFGPYCEIKENFAEEFGGGLYINQLSRESKEIVWVVGGNFVNNSAFYAGTNVAWNILTSSYPQDFCENCTFGLPPPSFQGYQTTEGWATPPSNLNFGESCPSNLNVVSNPFNVSTILLDYFGTRATGTIDNDNNVTITVDSYGDCELVTQFQNTQTVNASSGESDFINLTIHGKNQESCQLYFSAPLRRNVFIPPIACNISIYGCPDDEEVQVDGYNGMYDTCVEVTGKNYSLSGEITKILAGIALFLLILILCIFCCVFGKFIRKRYRRFKKMRTLIPDLERKPMVSLESILSDPKIPHIKWEEIVIKDRIGMGANGIVSRGIWKPKNKSLLKKYQTKDKSKDYIEIAVKELLMEQVELLNPVTLEEFLIEIKFLR